MDTVVFKHPNDLVGDSVQESEQTTVAVLREAKGKVLAIENACTLSENTGVARRACRTAVVRKLLAAARAEQEQAQCLVLLSSSKNRVTNLFQVLRETDIASYFPIDGVVCFDVPGDEELHLLLDLMLRKRRLSASIAAKQVALDRLCDARGRPRFGNAGAVETLVDVASDCARLSRLPASPSNGPPGKIIDLEEEDFLDDGCK